MKLLAVAALALVLVGCGGETGTFNEGAFISQIMTEPKVYQASMTSTGNIYVAVADDGTDRKGYAGYVCEVARGFASGELNPKLVKIVDQSTVPGDSDLKELGRYRCKFS